MREEVGDLWTYPCDARCVTTNGVVKANGELVMGAGVALHAAYRYPHLARYLGDMVRSHGNTPWVYVAGYNQAAIVSFPTKHHWRDLSDLELIRQSAELIKAEAIARQWGVVAMTRPGCGLGGLRWEDVKPVIAPILDTRFVVLTPPSIRR